MLGNNYILDKRKIAYTYNVTTAPAILPVSLAEVKAFLKLDASDTSEDAFLTMLINSAVEIGEKYTGRDFISRGCTTFRDNFYDPLELRRAKISAIDSINYLVDSVFTLISSTVYAVENTNNYPYIYLKENQSWPVDGDILPQAIRIIFTSGYGTAASSVPNALRIAILQHVNSLYTNRGDCSTDCSGGSNNGSLSSNLQALYNPFRVISVGSYERPPYRC